MKRLLCIFVTGLLLVCFAGAAWADLNAGLAAYQRKDYQAALEQFRPLAEAGDAQAQYWLAVMYSLGHGMREDPAKAAYWVTKAANQGLAKAQYGLARMHYRGYGVPQDKRKELELYRKSANGGWAEAQNYMGLVYQNGWGVKKDKVRAYMWFSIAAAQGDMDARMGRKSLARNMTPAQIAEAEQLASEWRPKR